MKMLQVSLAQRPCGMLGFESGLYRFHYSSSAPAQSIHPLMPASRVFYESPNLFPVFEQCLPVGFSQSMGGGAALKALETLGQAHWQALAFANPDSPRLVPRYVVNLQELLLANDGLAVWQRWANTLGPHAQLPGTCPTLRVHTREGLPNSLRADHCLLANPDATAPNLQATAERLAQASKVGVWCPGWRFSACKQVLVLDVRNMPGSVHRLAGLSSMPPTQAAELHPGTQWLLAKRIVGVFGGPNHLLTLINFEKACAGAGLVDTNPLLRLGLAKNSLVFMP